MHGPTAFPPDSSGVARRFGACIDRQIELSLALESLADSLPSRIDTYAAMRLADQLTETLRRCHRWEEARVFPVLLLPGEDVGPMLERLRYEHVEDEDHAADLGEALAAFVTRQRDPAGGEVGYMLRGLFTALRRHAAFDRDHVLPLYLRRCTRPALRAPPRPRARRDRRS